ncbi:MAG: efflux RND transporter periplasmic adaptor subunit [Thermodesulfobacteriota bacterium]
MSPRLRPFLFLILPLLLILGLGLTISAKKGRLLEAKKQAAAQELPPVNCIVQEILPGPIEDRLNLPGVIEPKEDLTLLAQVDGTIAKVLVREGEQVQKGQVLARIEEDDYRIALTAAKAAHRLAAADHKRNKELHAKKLLPQASLEASATMLLTRNSELEAAALKLSRCTIKAPLASVVQRLDAKVGLLVSRADPLARLVQVEPVLAVIGIPESDVAAVSRLTEVELTIQALERTVMGRRHFLSPAPQKNGRLFRLELSLANGDRLIRPGMFVRAQLIKERKEAALTVPLYAIITRDQEQFVMVADRGVARRQRVTSGIIDGFKVEITKGLTAGDKVIVEGQRQVDDGRAIKVVEDAHL